MMFHIFLNNILIYLNYILDLLFKSFFLKIFLPRVAVDLLSFKGFLNSLKEYVFNKVCFSNLLLLNLLIKDQIIFLKARKLN